MPPSQGWLGKQVQMTGRRIAVIVLAAAVLLAAVGHAYRADSGPCTVVIAGQRMFLIDAGAGAARNLTRMGFNPGDIEALFLTHFHSDHIDGLGEVRQMRARPILPGCPGTFPGTTRPPSRPP